MIANTYVVKPFGISEVKVIALKGEPGGPTQEQVNTAVEEYMDDHPEAQIPDGAVTTEKLASNAVAPYADNLVSSSYVSDSEPYLFRKTFAGVREDTELVGGSVVWNQLADNSRSPSNRNGLTITGGDGFFTISGTATASTTASGWFALSPTYHSFENHVIFESTKLVSGTVEGTISFKAVGSTTVAPLGTERILKPSTESSSAINISNGVVCADAKIRIQVFDLTLMFGPTVADYIYSLETATAGAGVAWCKAYNPKMFSTYHPYNAGTLMSVNTSAHKMVGFNQWDEEWELGWVDNTGANRTSSGQIRSTNYIPVLPNTQYFFKTPIVGVIVYFDADKNCLGNKDANGLGDILVPGAVRTTQSNCRYIRFWLTTATTYNNDICINFSDPSKNGTYEPYTAHTYPLDSSLTLRGIPKLDASNNLYYDGDVYKSDGTVERRYGVVDLGTLNWIKLSGYNYGTFQANLPDAAYSATIIKFIQTSNYTSATNSSASSDEDNYIWLRSNNGTRLVVKDTAKADMTAADFATSLSGVYFVYELAEPTTEQAEPYTELQNCDPNGTEEYIDTREVPIPVGHNTKYMRDLKKLLEGIPDAPSANGTYVLKATVSASGVTYAWVEG